MANPLAEAKFNVALGNRILANENILDALGHVSLRHPTDPNRYLLARSRSPQLVEPSDVLEFTLDSDPVEPPRVLLYAERVIHGEIYKARPDVMAVCHHHAPAVMPFVIAGVDIVPVFHMGAAMGETAPFWDSQDEFGDTNLLVAKPEEGASLARALGKRSAVLMRRHGATVVGADVRELVFRTIYMRDNAVYQMQAHSLGGIGPLTQGEVRMAGAIVSMPTAMSRTWEYWSMRLALAGRMPPGAAGAKMSKATPKRARPRATGTRQRAGSRARRR